ncbi:hypothetical protein C1H46_041201 [Malus baccata]|uniref:Uncharacterized protein n=1 Tax=Malus baccata TaxID=106549 RepID=A0A540KGH9_MALBA|nr:hypothetical protein C1H46_041201 [Malus baccata]
MESLDSLDDILDFHSDDAGAEDKAHDFKPSIAPSGVLCPDDPSRPFSQTVSCLINYPPFLALFCSWGLQAVANRFRF